jgi:hypothetical protein
MLTWLRLMCTCSMLLLMLLRSSELAASVRHGVSPSRMRPQLFPASHSSTLVTPTSRPLTGNVVSPTTSIAKPNPRNSVTLRLLRTACLALAGSQSASVWLLHLSRDSRFSPTLDSPSHLMRLESPPNERRVHTLWTLLWRSQSSRTTLSPCRWSVEAIILIRHFLEAPPGTLKSSYNHSWL